MSSSTCFGGGDPRLVGDPVDTLTGAVVDNMLDFRLTGFLELRWTRYYDSSKSHKSYSIGNGCAHEYDRSLSLSADGLLYEEPVRRSLRFPPLLTDGEEHAFHGFTVRRVSSTCYLMFRHAQPAMEFVFAAGAKRARLSRLFRGSFEVRFWYDAAQRLVRIDDSAGRRLVAEEDDAGRLTRLAVEVTSSKPGALVIAYHYDERGNLVATENDQGHGYAFAYDEANRLVLRRGRKGFQFYFKYDDQGRCIRAMGDDRLYGVALQYKVPGHLTKVTRPDRGVWTYKFTKGGQLEEIVDPLGGVQKFIRDATGRLVLEIDPNGNVTQFVYDAAGEAVAKIDPLGHTFTLPEDPNAPDPLADRVAANAAEYEYGRLVDTSMISLPNQTQVQASPLSPEARSLAFVRAEQGKDTAAERQFEVPPLRVLWWPEPKQGRSFNDLGKLVQQRDEFGRLRQWSYDESGNVAKHVDFDGGKWEYDYGSWHFLRKLTNPLDAEVRLSYTTSGQVAACVDAGETLSEYRYDLKDHLVEVQRHGVLREAYTRDAAGNLLAKHASDGRELLRFEIGPGNLPIKRMLASGDEHTFQYDRFGRQIIASTKKDHVQFAYDTLGNRILEKRNGIGVIHRFQGWRRPASSVFFNRFTVSYEWRCHDTLVITDPGGKSHEVQILAGGLVLRRFSSGCQETSQYDSLGRCLFKCTQHGERVIWKRRYHWSGEGELREVEDSLRGKVRHEYDIAHRLRRRFLNDHVEDYKLDRADNLIAQPGLADVALQDGNRIRTANGFTFYYNDRNHVSARQDANGSIHYGFDSRDQLIRVQTPSGFWEAEYDAIGRRTRKTWANQTTEYYWNSDQLAAEVQSDGRMRLYIYADPMALTPLLFLDYESVEAPPDSCRRYFVFSDQIGTPCLIVDDQRAVVWNALIAPFGDATISSGTAIDFNLRFPGHYLDVELNLHYNRHRYYDQVLGRYLQSDPWGISGGYNLYAYSSNPLLTVDAFGLGEDSDPNCRNREADAEGTGEKPPPSRRRMTDEELQSAADHIRNPNGDPRDFSTLTVTEGIESGRPVYTVTSSRRPSDWNDGHNLTPGERSRAAEVFGPDVRTPVEGRAPPGDGSHHSEQRGMRATADQTDRRQASSNNTMGQEGSFGAACSPCAACQGNATNSSGQPNPVQNVTGTVDNGGRTNNPSPGAWRDWTNE